MTTKKRKKFNPWKNYGDGIQVYDVLFEVDKLDSIARTDGKTSEKYQTQHKKTVKLIGSYNAENKGTGLSLGKSRSILQGPRYEDGVVFYNEGKKQASNRENLESEK